ncbi:hypothetical protein [Streptomyces sp. NPDC001165]|uniref:hypothetical protein n=1 Tax=Streptomyces sp. NPDC001165 TaxID=3364546 RepID=UPI0036B58EEA
MVRQVGQDVGRHCRRGDGFVADVLRRMLKQPRVRPVRQRFHPTPLRHRAYGEDKGDLRGRVIDEPGTLSGVGVRALGEVCPQGWVRVCQDCVDHLQRQVPALGDESSDVPVVVPEEPQQHTARCGCVP